MNQRTRQSQPVKLMIFSVLSVVLGIMIAFSSPSCRRLGHGHGLAEALNNVRQVKFALDGFATDFDGHFPNADTGQRVVGGGTGLSSSNDYFRQLFMAGETQSEQIFWVKNSPVAHKTAPDDKVLGADGNPSQDLILEPGDCHWAYLTGQTNTSNVERLLIMDPFLPGTTGWDEKLWDRKVIALRIDGSITALRMRISDGKVLDTSNHDYLSSDSAAWQGNVGEPLVLDPMALLVQPEPAN
ncbi:MAG: hypothetical protein VCA38_13955 [Roseibacillus sp.]|jgi:hypothetical protein